MNVNEVYLGGNFVRDPELRELPSSSCVVNFTIANDQYFTTAKGEKKKDTTFIDCEAWDTGAETIAKHFKKGSKILVRGRLKMDSWTDKTTGDKRSKLKLRVERFWFVESNRTPEDVSADEPAADEPVAVAAAASSGDDIPF